ncbi:MAG: carboxyltransferase domain-containing protein, partial [Comamonadaceae bacterium]
MRFLPVNLDALLVELDDLTQTLALTDSLRAQPIAGVEELVPGARTVLVRFLPHATTSERIAGDIARRRLVA